MKHEAMVARRLIKANRARIRYFATCGSVEMARNAAIDARRDGLQGMYPAACVVLDEYVNDLEGAIRDMLSTWNDVHSDFSIHDRIAQLRAVLEPKP